MKIIRALVLCFALLWLSFGLLLAIRLGLLFAKIGLPASPDGVQNALVLLCVHFGIPALILFLLLREKKQQANGAPAPK